uniref:H15 domain-containing protein n=1 Tax=Fundulus heteroclitus TaxID=8078 RepID=A0A3Q2NTT1_FUNHE
MKASKPKKSGPSVGELIVQAVAASSAYRHQEPAHQGTLVHTKGTGASGSFKMSKKVETKKATKKAAPKAKKPKAAAAAKKSRKKVKKPAAVKNSANSPKKVTKKATKSPKKVLLSDIDFQVKKIPQNNRATDW